MLLKWLDTAEATEVGAALADGLVSRTDAPAGSRQKHAAAQDPGQDLQRLLERVDREARPLRLNFLQRAKLANSFKWRLIEKGVERQAVDALTRALVIRLNGTQSVAAPVRPAPSASASRPKLKNAAALLAQATECLNRGSYGQAVSHYEELLSLDPRQALACNNLGAALCQLGRYEEAEHQFRRAIKIKSSYAAAHSNLGQVLKWRGRVLDSEPPLRRALKLKPGYVDAQVNLAGTLFTLGRWPEAKSLLERVLKVAPRNVEALVLLGQISAPEGRLEEAESLFKRAAEANANAPSPWAAQVWLRKMTTADAPWLKRAEEIAERGALAPRDEANLRFAIGKYWDDVGDYKHAFRALRRANELQKMGVEPYDREAHARLVDDLAHVYTREALARPPAGASDSQRPVFVVGMPRSGTSLVEQIIASHPAAHGAGELGFWSGAMRSFEADVRARRVSAPLNGKLAADYLRVLGQHSVAALRVVDKATFNSEYLGVIHSVFPRARVIYLRRDPIDACLSCYFHPLPEEMNFAMDLSDLAHYYREHQRLVAHWRQALPAGTLLDVPYAGLVADQERWTRRIIEFLGLEWDPRCLDFHRTERSVQTASYAQVRQKIYRSSVGRWRSYQKYLGPLLDLRDTEA